MINKSYTIIVCENEIQSNDIRHIFKKQSNINVLKIPKIITLDNWISSEYQDYLIIEKIDELLVLNGVEEKIIWEKIIGNDLKQRQEKKVTDVTNIAQQAINANRIISTYQIRLLHTRLGFTSTIRWLCARSWKLTISECN